MFNAETHTRALVSALFGCRNAKQIKQVHAQSIIASTIQNHEFTNKLLYSYVHHRLSDDVRTLFSSMKERNNVSWSVMVSGCAKLGDYSGCLDTFRNFIQTGGCADNYIVPSALRACRESFLLQVGEEVHQLVCKTGLEFDVFVSAALVDMYSKCGNIEGARKVFDRMTKRDLVTWTSMISGYAECADPEKSLAMFDRMLYEGVAPDLITMVAVAFSCAKFGALCKAKMIHEYIIKKKFTVNVILGTALIDMYAKCGSIEASREIFNEMEDKNVVSWSSMMSAYAFHRCGREAVDHFQHMLYCGIQPNRVTFLSVLYSYSHAGMGLLFFSGKYIF
jgi:pentatricopeptide repeat protein